MASFLYDIYKHVRAAPGTLGTTSGDAVDLEDDTLKFALLVTAHTPSASTDQDYADISAEEVGTSQGTGAVTVGTDGTFDCVNPTWTALSGTEGSYVALYKDTGTPGTSLLVALLDSSNVTGLPFTPSGTDVTLNIDAAGLFT